MKVALVHDYLNEYGGAERVLEALSELYPEAPIYTAFYKKNSPAYDTFKDKKIVSSWAQDVPFFASKLHSPLRFLTPLIWESFNLDEYDVIISSASWYITKGVITQPHSLHVCYCHTPPRYLYGYQTASDLQKYWLVRQYARFVNPMLRKYDFLAAQRVDKFIANSKNVQKRIEKFYRRKSSVIYPPVHISEPKKIVKRADRSYYLTGGRLVGPKHFDIAIQAANQLEVPLKVYGEGPLKDQLQELAGESVELLGRVDEAELVDLYAHAKAFIALAEDEDFGITPVEAMMTGTPVIAFRGGGFVESVLEDKTGVFVESATKKQLVSAIKKVDKKKFSPKLIAKHAKQFNKERFLKEMSEFVETKWKEYNA